jgi:hypothetical protein
LFAAAKNRFIPQAIAAEGRPHESTFAIILNQYETTIFSTRSSLKKPGCGAWSQQLG